MFPGGRFNCPPGRGDSQFRALQGPRSRRRMILDFTGKWMSQTRPDPFQVDVHYSTCKEERGRKPCRASRGRDEDARVNRGRSAGWMLSLTCFYRPTPVETPWPLHGQPPEAEPRARFAGILCPDNHLRRSRGHVLPSFGAQITTQGGSAAMFSRFSIKIYYEKHMKRKDMGKRI